MSQPQELIQEAVISRDLIAQQPQIDTNTGHSTSAADSVAHMDSGTPPDILDTLPDGKILSWSSFAVDDEVEMTDEAVETWTTYLSSAPRAVHETAVKKWANALVLASPEISDAMLALLGNTDASIRAETAHALMRSTTFGQILKRWMLDPGTASTLRIAAMEQARGIESESDIPNWMLVAQDQDPAVASVAQEALLDSSKHQRELFPYFMEYLVNGTSGTEGQLSMLGSRVSRWSTPWLPQSTELEIWSRVPAASITLLVRLLQEPKVSLNHDPEREEYWNPGWTIGLILRQAPELPKETLDVLVELWNNVESKQINMTRGDVLDILMDKSVVPASIIDELIALHPNYSDNSDALILPEVVVSILVQQHKFGKVDGSTIMQMINNTQSPHILDVVCRELVVQGIDVPFVPKLNDKALFALSSAWLRGTNDTELNRCEDGSGLVLQRRDAKIKIDLDPGQIERCLTAFAAAKADNESKRMLEDNDSNSENTVD